MNYESIQCTTHRRDINAFLCTNACILYNLQGKLDVFVNDKKSELTTNDVMVVNPNSIIACHSMNAFYVKYELDGNELKACFSNKAYSFVCDSSSESAGNYDRLRKILSEILIVLQVNHEHTNIKLNQLFYDLVLFLLNNFSIEQVSNEQTEKEQLMDYIENHYFEELSLQEISSAFNMSSQYFSKYFKKHVGVPYLKYLTDVRLLHAHKEVVNTNKRFILIAMDNGFPNISAFNHYFKEKYGEKPKEYREKYSKTNVDYTDEWHEYAYAIENLGVELDENTKSISLVVDSEKRKKYKPFWRKLIHLGDSTLLDSALVLDQLREMQSSLRFEFIRIYLDRNIYKIDNSFNFVREEIRFNELYRMGFKIWLSIDLRDIKNIDGFCTYLNELLSFMTRQWSISNIRQWYFELTYNSIFDETRCINYIEYMEKIKEVLKKFGCEENVVVAGLCLGNKDGIHNFYQYLNENEIQYKHHSFVVEPYVYSKDENGMEIVRATTENNVHNDLLGISKSNPYYEKVVENVFITSWRENLQQFNVMNDSCYKGALVIKNFLDCFDQVDSLPQNIVLDSIYDPDLRTGILFGGDGLMNYHGIKKPSYYAYYFMSNVGGWFLGRNEKLMVFGNDYGNFNVVAHNCKKLGYRYFMEEENLDINHIDDYFENLDPLDIHVRIENVENGLYEIKKRSVSSQRGSVQEEMLRMIGNHIPYIHPNDIEFLNNVSIPYLQVNEMTVTNNILDINVTLKANEFIQLHIIHQN